MQLTGSDKDTAILARSTGIFCIDADFILKKKINAATPSRDSNILYFDLGFKFLLGTNELFLCPFLDLHTS